VQEVDNRFLEDTMYALHLPSRHLLLAGLFALALALVLMIAADWLTTMDFTAFTGGDASAQPIPTPPATWATDPLAPPSILLSR
jgi:hypothetical protein